MKQFVVFALLASFLFLGCKKKENEEQLPAPSQSGANMLACKVNGVVHTYNGKGSYFYDNGVNYYKLHGSDSSIVTTITADKTSAYADFIAIEITTGDIEIGKEYIVSNELNKDRVTYTKDNVSNGDYITTINSGKVVFTRCDNIAAGTFYFTATNAQGEKVEITEGRFDIQQD